MQAHAKLPQRGITLAKAIGATSFREETDEEYPGKTPPQESRTRQMLGGGRLLECLQVTLLRQSKKLAIADSDSRNWRPQVQSQATA